MPYTKHLIIVIPAIRFAKATTACKTIDAIGGDNSLNVPLSPTGILPATHFWCCWCMTAQEHTALFAQLDTQVGVGNYQVFDFNSTTPEEVLKTLGLQTIKPAA